MKIVVVDSSQIEARVNAWVSGHEELLALFRQGDALGDAFDIYAVIGSDLFGQEITKKTHPLERQVSKNLSLGLGFQMSWFRLAMEMAKGMLGAKPVIFDLSWVDRLNVDLRDFASDEKKLERIRGMPSRLGFEDRVVHCAVADYFVRWYRAKNKPIKEFWDTCRNVIEAMESMDPNLYDTFGANECLKVMRHRIQLPNGLYLRYPGLRASLDDDGDVQGFSYMGGPVGKERKRIYGGLLTENCVQALARVIVYQQAVNIWKKYGYRFAMTSHDELVYAVSDAEAQTCFERVTQEMRTTPSWAPGLPLSTSGDIGQTYGDAK